jgi:CHAD domain-containing protein
VDGAPTTAAWLLDQRVRDQTNRLRRCLELLDNGDPAESEEAVHDARVAVRRLRSALATFSACVDPELAVPVRVGLARLARELGGPRDDQVAAQRLIRMVAELTDDDGPEVEALRNLLAERSLAAGVAAGEVAGSAWVADLLTQLDELRTLPAWTQAAREADPLPYVWQEWRRLSRRVRRLSRNPAEPVAEEMVHDVRKAAKRMRHTVEVVGPLDGPHLERHTRRIGDILGEHQDTVLTRRRLAAVPRTVANHDLRTLLVTHEEDRAAALVAEFWTAWAPLDDGFADQRRQADG